jgi:hypothetical protein
MPIKPDKQQAILVATRNDAITPTDYPLTNRLSINSASNLLDNYERNESPTHLGIAITSDTEDDRLLLNYTYNPLKSIVFFIFGISMLLPWNTWITITSWFAYRLKYSAFSDVFPSYFAAVFMSSNIIFLFFFIRYPNAIPIYYRIIFGFLITCGVFILGMCLTYAAAIMPSMDYLGASAYFYITLILICISSFASSLLTGIMGLASQYKPTYITFMTSGQGISFLYLALLASFRPWLKSYCWARQWILKLQLPRTLVSVYS